MIIKKINNTMAKENRKNPFLGIRSSIDDMRTGLNDAGKSVDRIALAKFCRVVGIGMLVASVMYLIVTLRSLGVFG